MSGKGMAVTLTMMLCAATVQGFPMFRGGRCRCIDPGVQAVKVAEIEKLSILYPSSSCDKVEMIVTLKAQKRQKCLNPTSRQARLISKKIERNNFFKASKHMKSGKRKYEHLEHV